MNVILVTGRLGRDPEMRYSSDGTPWAVVSVAEGGDDPNWFEVKCFDRTAEVLNEYGTKGRRVAIQGHMAQENYEKDGKAHKAWRLIADWVEFLDTRKGDRKGS